GDVLHSTHADAIRYPASLTKIMTLYLLFERLEAGRVKLDTQMEVSSFAASQAPTKLGLKPGQTLMVEDAIKALVTKSANDAAVVIAEHLAGSQEEFARQMTRKARALRMSRTVYRNANGLPDSAQVTTARDQALLGLAIQDRFPRYYRYFATRSFAYRGVRMSNHNRLLGRVTGVNGIKTGYTRASGFNLVSAVERGDRRIVAVVLGGTSAGARDARMRNLIEQKFSLASVKRTAPKIVEIAEAAPLPLPKPDRPARIASAAPTAAVKAEPVQKPETRAADAAPVPVEIERPVPGSTDPIKPLLVKTFTVKAGLTKTVAAMSMLAPEPIANRNALATTGSAPKPESKPETQRRSTAESLPPPPPGARPGVLGVLTAKDVAQLPAQRTVTASIAPVVPQAPAPKQVNPVPAGERIAESKPRSGWVIQVGAFEDRGEAREKLTAVKSRAGDLLKGALPYTEVFEKGDKRFFRARFTGLKESAAEQACKELQRNRIACFATRN
ncbi:serine hydrolase, partial [Pseudorhodoplanes sp.]|uniref:serine hydrolase n=1 Tax=Pseudorhodoplanes sp. TaxID=1934341 RepID=UPI003D12F453